MKDRYIEAGKAIDEMNDCRLAGFRDYERPARIESYLRKQFSEVVFTQKDILLKAMKEIAIGECFVGDAQNRKEIVSKIAFTAIKEVEALDDRP